MDTPYTPPQFNRSSFNCPHCKAFSSMSWDNAYIGHRGVQALDALRSAHCAHCNNYSLWIGSSMIYPWETPVESPNQDLSEDIKTDYLEAANIVNQSSRGAAALLRLSIEKLVNSLDAKGKDLNAKIGNLVANGLNPKIQKALDVVRVIGNEAVHPGQIDLKDDPETAQALFRLVNVIADGMITKPKEVDALFDELVPESHKKGIIERDSE